MSPFVGPVPEELKRTLLIQQAARFHQNLPLLCMVIAANALAMTLAVLGDLPWWQQLAPPLIIITVCLVALARHHGRSATTDPRVAEKQLKGALITAALLGPLAGAWCVNAFSEMEKYYCMTAPVFIGIAALVSATCLQSVPRAALAVMIGAVTPIVIKLAMFDYLGIRAMAIMMVVLTALQANVVIGKFRETVRTLILQRELEELSHTDPLTGIGNRREFMATLHAQTAKVDASALLLMLDLDGFKAANDTHGHQAGDAILSGVAGRLRALVPNALSVARLGGDEFAILIADEALPVPASALAEAVRDAIAVPFQLEGEGVAWVGASVGVAHFPDEAKAPDAIMHLADQRLYKDKSARRKARKWTEAGKAVA